MRRSVFCGCFNKNMLLRLFANMCVYLGGLYNLYGARCLILLEGCFGGQVVYDICTLL